jgi:hypothetical protein
MYKFHLEKNNNNTITIEGEGVIMRFLFLFTILLSAAALLYKWRYRVVNLILAISFLRRLAVSISMRMPGFRKKLLPGLFSKQSKNTPSN